MDNSASVMEQNLARIINSDNYFSCFVEHIEPQEPINPFEKKLFDKNLRRSTVSCGHYQSHRQSYSSLNKCALNQESVEVRNNKSHRHGYDPSRNQQQKHNYHQKHISSSRFVSEPSDTERQNEIRTHYNNSPTRNVVIMDGHGNGAGQNSISKVGHLIARIRQQIGFLQEKALKHIQYLEGQFSSNQISHEIKSNRQSEVIESINKVLNQLIVQESEILESFQALNQIQNQRLADSGQKQEQDHDQDDSVCLAPRRVKLQQQSCYLNKNFSRVNRHNRFDSNLENENQDQSANKQNHIGNRNMNFNLKLNENQCQNFDQEYNATERSNNTQMREVFKKQKNIYFLDDKSKENRETQHQNVEVLTMDSQKKRNTASSRRRGRAVINNLGDAPPKSIYEAVLDQREKRIKKLKKRMI